MHYADSPGCSSSSAARVRGARPPGNDVSGSFLRTRVRPLFVPFAPGRETAADLLRGCRRGRAVSPGIRSLLRRDAAVRLAGDARPVPVIVLIPGLGCSRFRRTQTTARSPRSSTRARSASCAGPRASTSTCRFPSRRPSTSSTGRSKRRSCAAASTEEPAGARRRRDGGRRRDRPRHRAPIAREGRSSGALRRRPIALDDARQTLTAVHGVDRIRAVECDVRRESAVRRRSPGRLRSTAESTSGQQRRHCIGRPDRRDSLDTWQQNLDVLTTGYFLVARETFRVMKAEGRGGSIVFVGSKNALVASPGAAAYCTAKAAALHLARCLAVEGAPFGIRVNVVNPDAVIRGSRIWSGEWRAQRAASNRIPEDRSKVLPRSQPVPAERLPGRRRGGGVFFASDRSGKSTGNILNVDAGHVAAFTR